MTKKINNLDILYYNCNAKSVHVVLVNHFDKDPTIMMSYDDKCVFKIGAHECLLALFPKTKTGWIAEEVET